MLESTAIFRTFLNIIGFKTSNESSYSCFAHKEYDPKVKKEWKEHLDNLREIHNIANRINAQLLIVLIPPKWRIYRFLTSREAETGDLERELCKFFDEQQIHYLDLNPFFEKYKSEKKLFWLDSKEDLYWRFDGHINNNGNKLTALLIARLIIDHNLIKISDKDKKKDLVKLELGGMFIPSF
jgi:hypothetical protein